MMSFTIGDIPQGGWQIISLELPVLHLPWNPADIRPTMPADFSGKLEMMHCSRP